MRVIQFGVVAAVLATLAPFADASAYTETVLYRFKGGADGAIPMAGLLMDTSGALYGTTSEGGNASTLCIPQDAAGCGTVFKLTPPAAGGTSWKESILHRFSGTDGGYPEARLIADSQGNLYGTTSAGGNTGSLCPAIGSTGCGVVFRLTPPAPGSAEWTRTVLHRFSGTDGSSPVAALAASPGGVLYGTTFYGGAGSCHTVTVVGCGTVFSLTPPPGIGAWTETVLYRLSGTAAASPAAGVILDSSGALYGTSAQGGDGYNHGTVFKLTPPTGGQSLWTKTILHRFDSMNGANPWASLLMDAAGALYGTTQSGGRDTGTGVVFRLNPPVSSQTAWTETVLYSTTRVDYGAEYQGALVADPSGALYGTTVSGGSHGAGIAFKLTPPPPGSKSLWTETLLHTFTGKADGGYPEDGLIEDSNGNFYGTAAVGGPATTECAIGCGVVFELTP